MFKQSEQINEIAKALSAFQGEVENAAKSSTNPFFSSKYADLGEVLNTIRPVMGKHGLALAQFPSFEGDCNGGLVHVESLLSHSSGQWLSCVTSAPVFPTTGRSGKAELVSSQTIGSATTYCRRYAAAAMLGIGQEDDDGNSTSGKNAADKGEDQRKVEPKKEAKPMWNQAEDDEFKMLLDKIGSHLRVENTPKSMDELDNFTEIVLKSKANYPATVILPQLRIREKEFAARATKFIKAVVNPPKDLLPGALPLEGGE
jgi:hypothetical protein